MLRTAPPRSGAAAQILVGFTKSGWFLFEDWLFLILTHLHAGEAEISLKEQTGHPVRRNSHTGDSIGGAAVSFNTRSFSLGFV